MPRRKSTDTCNHCSYRWTDDTQETIDHLRTHWDIFDEVKRHDLDRWEQFHHRHLQWMAERTKRVDPDA